MELKGLVDSRLYGNTKYLNPVDVANEYARELKHTHQCDLIICLSHLGYSYNEDKISDVNLVKLTRNIDLVIGGHTHTFLEKAEVHKNIENKDVLINQVGWAGIKLGRIDFFFNKLTKKQIKNVTNSTSLDV